MAEDIQQQIADGARPRLARVDDVIEHGQSVPDNVVAMTDADGKSGMAWRRMARNPLRFRYYPYPGAIPETATSGTAVYDFQQRWFPLKVVEVDPEPQPAEPSRVHAFVRGEDDCCDAWLAVGTPPLIGKKHCGHAEGSPIHLQPAERKLIGPPHAHLDAPCTDACYEPAGARDADGCLRLKGTATGDNQLDPEPQPAEPHWVYCSYCYSARQYNSRHCRSDGTCCEPAESGPLVLTLPQVPRKDVTLVGRQGTRFVPVGGASWQAEVEGGRCFGLGELIDLAGPLTVEMAPPREPRTWPKLDDESALPAAVRGASGQVYRQTRSGHDGYTGGTCHASMLVIIQQVDGPLTEVLP